MKRSQFFVAALLTVMGIPGQSRAGDGTCTISHRVESGEFPGTIAKAVYRHFSWWPVVTAAADITDPRKLPASTPDQPFVLTLPCSTEAERTMENHHTPPPATSGNFVTARPIFRSRAVTPSSTPAWVRVPASKIMFGNVVIARDSFYSTIRDNNPLSVTRGKRTEKWILKGYAKVKKYQGLPYLSFVSPTVGLAAGVDLLFQSGAYPTSMTLDGALRKWSGKHYDSRILGRQVDGNRTLGTLNRNEKVALILAIAKQEHSKTPVRGRDVNAVLTESTD